MPKAAPRPCKHPGCKALVSGGSYCADHARPAAGSFADQRRGSRHERGYGTKWDKIRERILKRDAGLCQECLRQGKVTPVGHKPFTAYVDHIINKAEGGTDDDENLQTLCRRCHQIKTDGEKNRRGRGGSKVQPPPP